MTLEEKVNLGLSILLRIGEKENVVDPWEKWMVTADISERDLEKVDKALILLADDDKDSLEYNEIEKAIRDCGFSSTQAKYIFGILYGTYGPGDLYENVKNIPNNVKVLLKEVDLNR
jgi:endonuclease III